MKKKERIFTFHLKVLQLVKRLYLLPLSLQKESQQSAHQKDPVFEQEQLIEILQKIASDTAEIKREVRQLKEHFAPSKTKLTPEIMEKIQDICLSSINTSTKIREIARKASTSEKKSNTKRRKNV